MRRLLDRDFLEVQPLSTPPATHGGRKARAVSRERCKEPVASGYFDIPWSSFAI
jgi:hypothetical protein